MKEYRICIREHGGEHTSCVAFRDWGGRQNWQENKTDEIREEEALKQLEDRRRFHRTFYGVAEVDTWLEVREVGPWQEVDA